jgi:large subunit ribosomal protein L29
MKANELREKSSQELEGLKKELSQEQFNLRMQQGAKNLAKNHLVKQARRNIARVNTILTEKKVKS